MKAGGKERLEDEEVGVVDPDIFEVLAIDVVEVEETENDGP